MTTRLRSALGATLVPLREWRRRALAREALALMALSADRAPGCDEALTRWLLRSKDHVAVWLDVTAFHEEVARSLQYPELATIAVAIDRRATPALSSGAGRRPPAARHPLLRAAPALLAAGMAVLSVVVGLRMEFGAGDEYSTEVGQHRAFGLEDGTTVHLNTDSRIAVHYSADERAVELQRGEALFDVAPDPRPLRVRTQRTVIEDIGTRFDVRLGHDHVDVLVLEGEVRVAAHDAEPAKGGIPAAVLALRAGQTASVPAVPGTTAPSVENASGEELSRKLAWTAGMLRFKDEPLREAVRQFNRHNRRQIRIVDPYIGELRIGGQFRATNPDRFAHALAPWGVAVLESSQRQQPDDPILLVRAQP